MTDQPIDEKKIAFALAAVATAAGGLVLVFLAAFPYIYAESGSARYAREHSGEAMLEVAGAAILFWVSWQCIRRSLSVRSWLTIAGVLIAAVVVPPLAHSMQLPRNALFVGDRFYVVADRSPGEIDTISYQLYYRHGPFFDRIDDLVGEFRFVSPDCVIYRGLKVVGRPTRAMCGYRLPFETMDSTIEAPELVSKARARPSR
jgi:hypothetical protein